MEIDDYRDEFGFTGPLPITSNQRRLPAPGFDPGPRVGEPLPDFSLSDPRGRRVTLHDDRGGAKAALVFLRSAVWSPSCLTQLSELRAAQPAFEAAGVKLYAVSYDDRDALAECAAALGLRFPLLSDPSSSVIWRFGLLNTLLAPGDIPFYGAAHPGTFLVDGDGAVVAKHFHRHMSVRVSPETLLDAALGRIALEDEPRAEGGSGGARVTVFLRGGGGVIRMGLVRQLVVRFELEAGVSLRAPVRVEVAGPEGLHVEAARSCAGDLVVPVWASSDLVCLMSAPKRDRVALDVTLHYEVARDGGDREARSERLSLEVPVAPHVVPNLPQIAGTGHRVVAMDSLVHFQRLLRRAIREEDAAEAIQPG